MGQNDVNWLPTSRFAFRGLDWVTVRHENPKNFFWRHWKTKWKIKSECTSKEHGNTCLKQPITPSGSRGMTENVDRSGINLLTAT